MPILINPDQMHVIRSGDGWTEIMLADSKTIGAAAMAARRWVLQPGAHTEMNTHGDTDQLLYVMRGSGEAVVDGTSYSLAYESILWLEPGETYHFVAGSEGLEILQGYAPGD